MTEQPILVDVHAAAALAHTTPEVVRQWAHRGYLTRHGARNRRLYDVREIVEHATRADTAGHQQPHLSRSDADGPRVSTPGSSP